jgi:four helix bundle suffix protein
MKIVVNHLTRMQKGFMCVAGVNLETGRHVRPLLRQQMRTTFLTRNGGLFDIGRIVDLGRTRYIGKPPEVEDHLFYPHNAAPCDDMAPPEFWRLLTKLAKPKLVEIFGPELHRRGRGSCAVELGHGIASLGCFVADNPRLILQEANGRHRIRMRFQSGSHEFDVPVTDIRLYGSDHVTPDRAIVSRTAERLESTASVVLSVGLTRPFKKTAAEPALHWLQVNNIHFAEDPVWQLGYGSDVSRSHPGEKPMDDRNERSDGSDGSDILDRTGRSVRSVRSVRSNRPSRTLRARGGYRDLRSFQVAEIIYDATVAFCDRFIDRKSRTHDQMVQAARSGRQNIAEGSRASGTSSQTELRLVGVARASLDELLLDYEDFLRQRRLTLWGKDDPRTTKVRTMAKNNPDGTDQSDVSDRRAANPTPSPFDQYRHLVEQCDPETSANTVICLIHQANYLLDRQIEELERQFIEDGGYTEQLAAARRAFRAGRSRTARKAKDRTDRTYQTDQSDPSDPSDQSAPPTCPKCGGEMVRRTARKGARAGSPFWGCPNYPDCNGILPVQ